MATSDIPDADLYIYIYNIGPHVWLLTSLQLIQVLQQQIQKLLHSHQSLDARRVNELFGTLQPQLGNRGLGLPLAAVPLPPLIHVARQRGDFRFDPEDPVEGVGDQAVVTVQDRHYGGRSVQVVSRCQAGRVLQQDREQESVVSIRTRTWGDLDQLRNSTHS